jgi:hypothetical protein
MDVHLMASRDPQLYVRDHIDVLRTVVGFLRQFSSIYSNIINFSLLTAQHVVVFTLTTRICVECPRWFKYLFIGCSISE